MAYQKIGSLKSVADFRDYLQALASDVLVDEDILAGEVSPLAQPLDIPGARGTLRLGNRWAIQPMEGWDGTPEGRPSELTRHRWQRFGESGAKLIWGGEAVAVVPEGRANPGQLLSSDENAASLEELRETLEKAHRERWGTTEDLVVGLQLTHSGRFAQPESKDRRSPRVAYRHPLLDESFGVRDDSAVVSDAEVEEIIGAFVGAAVRARDAGYAFVDIKHCHGYLLNEFLGAHTREGPYGGSFANRTRLTREIVSGVRREAPDLEVGVRVSIFDMVPFRKSMDGNEGRGAPVDHSELHPYQFGFGVDAEDPTNIDLHEGLQFLELLCDLKISLVNISGGSPYYTPHIQRPALYPPSDSYQPPEDPLLGVVRQLRACRDLKRQFPQLTMVGSALSYLQDYLPHVAQALVREGWMDFVGLGRIVLSYWDLPGDCLEGKSLTRRRFCRTFSDCTTAPRNGLVSGCYPLDRYYAERAEAAILKEAKAR